MSDAAAIDDDVAATHALVQELDLVVRQEIRSAFAEEFQALGGASRRATEALEAVSRAASLRIALWAFVVVAACTAVPLSVAWAVLPGRGELSRMRAERDRLETSITNLERRGGHIDLRRCGPAGRLCVRVERAGPAYGAQSDYLIIKGG